MMNDAPKSMTLLEELDTRQNEILDQLEELNQKVQQVLGEYLNTRAPEKDEVVTG